MDRHRTLHVRTSEPRPRQPLVCQRCAIPGADGRRWRDLPERFGSWNTVARRFRRWALAGAWERIFQAVQEPDYEWVLVDSTTVKAHKAAAGQKKARPQPRP